MTTYYVDTNAAAGGNGTTSATTGANCAWDTIADVNAASFSAGDSVLFNRGCTWNEQLTVPSSGTAGNVITFGAYGSGDNPVIDGTTVQTGWTAHEGNVYTKSQNSAANVYQVFEDGVRLTWKADHDAMAAGSWTYTTGTPGIIYVWSSDNADPDTHTIEYCDTTDNTKIIPIRLNGQSYITFDGIDVTKANNSSFNTDVTGSDNIIIKNCTVSYSGERSILIGVTSDNSDMNATNITIDNVTAHDSLDPGIWSGRGDTFTIQNCTVYNIGADVNPNGKLYPKTGDAFGKVHFPDGILIRNMTNCTVQNNYVYSIYGNDCIFEEFSDAMDQGTGNIIRYNHVVDNVGLAAVSAGIRLQGDDTLTYYNLIESTNGYAIHTQAGISGQVPDGNLIYNNTIYSGVGSSHSVLLQSGTNTVFKNNIVYRNGGTTNRYMSVFAASASTADFSNNVYYGAGTGRWLLGPNAETTTFATWVTQAGDGDSVNADPLFVNAAGGDFRLQAGSPCINAGVDVGLTQDYFGRTVPY